MITEEKTSELQIARNAFLGKEGVELLRSKIFEAFERVILPELKKSRIRSRKGYPDLKILFSYKTNDVLVLSENELKSYYNNFNRGGYYGGGYGSGYVNHYHYGSPFYYGNSFVHDLLWYNLLFNNSRTTVYNGYGYGYNPYYPLAPLTTETETTTTTTTETTPSSSDEESKSSDSNQGDKSSSETTVTKTVTKQGSTLSIWQIIAYGLLYFGATVAMFWILFWILKLIFKV